MGRCDSGCKRRATAEWWWADADGKPDRVDLCGACNDRHALALTSTGWVQLMDVADTPSPQTLLG